ncbi:helix-turn-helix domain-containing protein [Olsenella uli]|uniref:helix-turn-helix domain-containing protein n=1 Tax=Olsenella uli TaxID=133926 RepID=UPI0021CA089D|nr:helix-turn-helix domain-containing protein [Olsenella uli]
MTTYDRSVRVFAADLFERGAGRRAVASRLGVPEGTVSQWQLEFRAPGRDGLLDMGHRGYDWDTKVRVASAVAGSGKPKPEVMAELGIASRSPLDAWCRA